MSRKGKGGGHEGGVVCVNGECRCVNGVTGPLPARRQSCHAWQSGSNGYANGKKSCLPRCRW